MSEWAVEPYRPEGDSREKYLVREYEGRHIVRSFIVVGDEKYANSVAQQQADRAKRAPIRYRPNGVI